jgi:hypothetical protein
MKIIVKMAALSVAFLLAGCGAGTLPKPNTPKTAGVTALVAYGLATHVANQYFVLPLCTKPLTVVPCKDATLEAKMHVVENAAYDAAVAADNAANNTVLQVEAKNKLDDFKAINAQANGGKQ